MAHLIDTDVLIDAADATTPAGTYLESLASEGLVISVVTYMEAFQGVLATAEPVRAEAIFNRQLADIPILPVTIDIARRCARLRHALKIRGRRTRSRSMDLIIAATALEYGLALITRNRDDDDDIPGLALVIPGDIGPGLAEGRT